MTPLAPVFEWPRQGAVYRIAGQLPIENQVFLDACRRHYPDHRRKIRADRVPGKAMLCAGMPIESAVHTYIAEYCRHADFAPGCSAYDQAAEPLIDLARWARANQRRDILRLIVRPLFAMMHQCQTSTIAPVLEAALCGEYDPALMEPSNGVVYLLHCSRQKDFDGAQVMRGFLTSPQAFNDEWNSWLAFQGDEHPAFVLQAMMRADRESGQARRLSTHADLSAGL